MNCWFIIYIKHFYGNVYTAIVIDNIDLNALSTTVKNAEHFNADLPRKWRSGFEGATKFNFMYYFRVVIVLFRTGLYKSAFSIYVFGKTSFSFFCVLVFRVSVSLGFHFYFCSMFWIQCLLKDLITLCYQENVINHGLFNFVLTSFKRSVKI